MKTIILSFTLFASISTVTACKKSGSSCEEVFDHTVSLMPAELQSKLQDGKADALAKCEKLSPAARQCALDAKSMQDLMKCPRQ